VINLTDSKNTIIGKKLLRELGPVSRKIFHFSNLGIPRIECLRKMSRMLIEFSGCNNIELWMTDEGLKYQWKAKCEPEEDFSFRILDESHEKITDIQKNGDSSHSLKSFCSDIMQGYLDPQSPYYQQKGGFLITSLNKCYFFDDEKVEMEDFATISMEEGFKSILVIPFLIEGQHFGILIFKNEEKDFFSKEEIEVFQSAGQILGMAVANRRAHAALRERIKELRCLYGICQTFNRPGMELEDILNKIVRLIPPAMQYPEIAYGRITIDKKMYETPGFIDNREKLHAGIYINGKNRGSIEVTYTRKKAHLEAVLFLKEESALIDSIARQVGIIIEQKQAEKEKMELQKQIRHADRLATIGQLAAGVAHELNEPLANILGFAQLAQKCPGVPEQASQDMGKIVRASLYGREIVKKLLIFARQMPTRETRVNLNNIVEDALFFFESRLMKERIELEKQLSPDIPKIKADPSQLNQVIINLVVNAMQAIRGGGKIMVKTLKTNDHVSLVVKDTGMGIREEIIDRIFHPFFTTKKVGQGTGLGLAVVYGIVTAHGGSVKVKSEIGVGSEFEILLPIKVKEDPGRSTVNEPG